MAKFYSPIDLLLNELKNARIELLASHPTTTASGHIYFNTTNLTLYIYNGTAWVPLSRVGHGNEEHSVAFEVVSNKENLSLLAADPTIKFPTIQLVKTAIDTLTTWTSGELTDLETLIGTKVDKVAGKGLSSSDYTTDEKTKLSLIEAEANKYIHPIAHLATMITEDSTHRFVTDTEKTNWNAKASTAVVTVTVNGLMSYTDKVKLNGIADNANNYTHPANHAPSIITQDASNRFVTDTEKATWNAKGSSNLVLGNTSVTAYRGDRGEIAYNHATSSHAPSDANNYIHPTGDGNLHVPATGTGNEYKVLVAGPTPGAMSWEAVVDNDTITTINGKTGVITKADIVALGIPAQDTVYTHPANHPPTIITQDASNRFVTDTEKATWNAKAPTDLVTTSTNGLMAAVDKTKLDGIAVSANNYVHPANHPASIITQDTSNRFVTDAEKTTWNAKQSALGFTPENISNKGASNGYASLDATGKVPSTQLPSYVDDVVEYTNFAAFPGTGETDKIYVDKANNKIYRWSGTVYTEISASLALGETSNTAYRGDYGKIAYDHSQVAHAPSDAPSGTVFGVHINDTVAHITASERTTWNAKSNLALGTSSVTAHRGDHGVIAYNHSQVAHAPSDANYYVHPANHPPTIITQDANNRFVTDAEKTSWNAKAPTDIVTISVNGLMSATDKVKLNGIADNANNYSHPSNHAPSIITQDASNRFVTDAEKTAWNAKSDLILGVNSTNAYRGDYGKIAYDHSQVAHAPSNANFYQHPLGDGNLHVPATGAVSNGKVLKAGATAGTFSWGDDNDTVTSINGKVGIIEKADIVALGIPAQDTIYTHPANHLASIITQDASNRFVTDAEKTTWNAKASTAVVTTTVNGLMSYTDKVKLNGIADSANNYVHPANHPASVITQDASNRFVTDAEKATWNAKATTDVVTTSVNGLMIAADKVKLNGIATGAEVNQNAFNTISVSGQNPIIADAKMDTLTLVAGTNVTITTDDTTDTITITSANTTYTASNGIVLSGNDIRHVDTSTQANVTNSGRSYIQSVTLDTYGHITALTSATETVVDTNTTYDISAVTTTGGAFVRLTAGGSGSGTDDVKLASGTNVTVAYTDANTITINAVDTVYTHPTYTYTPVSDTVTTLSSIPFMSTITQTNGHVTGSTHRKLVAGTNVTITPSADGNITISSTDTNTIYTHPTQSAIDVNATDDGFTIIDRVQVNTLGHVTAVSTRTLVEATTSTPGVMSAADKTKLDGIASGAEVNVQSDWNAVSGDAFIVNKPTLGTSAALNTGTTNGTVPIIGANNKIDMSLIPASAITDTFVVASQVEMLALSTAEVGDVAVRTDINKTFILKTLPYSTLGNWQELLTPTDAVTSVAGKTGIVSLIASDVGLGNVTNESKATMFTSPTFTGTITGVTPAVATNNTVLASTAYVVSRIAQDATPIAHAGATGAAHGIATTSVHGFMSSTDKSKLDGIATGAQANQNAFSSIVVSGQNTIAADTATDAVTFVAGTNVSITTNDATDTVTFNATNTDTTYSVSSVTTTGGAFIRLTAGGSGSGTDDVKLASGTNTTVEYTDANTITISSTDTVYTHPTYSYSATANTGVVLTGITLLSDLTVTNGHVSAATYRKLVAGTNITITPEADGDIVITASDTNTATAADNILKGSNSGTQVTYAPHTTNESDSATPRLYNTTDNPTGSSRLNVSSHFYATRLYDNGVRVVTTDRQVIAGNGLTGGGDLTANNTVTLGTPSTITEITTNSVTSTSHTHAITGFYTKTESDNNYVNAAGDTMSGDLVINGSLYAVTKSFLIKHPTKPGLVLKYGSLEGPENGVYFRGISENNIIELPEYWTELVDESTITVNLTPIGKHQKLYIDKIMDNKVYIKQKSLFKKSLHYSFTVFAERKDTPKLEVESEMGVSRHDVRR